MTDTDTIELSPEATKVIDWRKQWLRASGYNKRNAELIATDIKIDLHFACNLLKNSRDENVCMRILF